MKKSKFTEAQIAFAIKQFETGTRLEEICRKWVSVKLLSTIGRKNIGSLPSFSDQLNELWRLTL